MTKYLKKILYQLLILIVGLGFIHAQEHEWDEDSLNTGDYNAFLEVIETTLMDYYRDFSCTEAQTDSIIKAFGYDYEDVPSFSDSVYCERLSKINEMSPFQLECHPDVLKTVQFFAAKRRNFISVVMGRSQLYFNMFEEKLAKHDLPLELKYLSVIESGLRPTVKSRAGALGLWQFMFRTGKAYGLDQNSYIDERMDPELATEAACLYLKKLHGLYDDWNMALAAYNAGPGNVNKAIRRSGGKMTYWEIRPYLPRETQGYVPNFIAAAYLMTYHAEHNILPREAKIHDFEVDTVCLKAPLRMATIDSLLEWPAEEVKALNPIYKTNYIPKYERHKCIQIPTVYIDKWIAMEDSLYRLDSLLNNTQVQDVDPALIVTTENYHYVKKGQTLSHIAGLYRTTVNNLMRMNNLRSTKLSIGQRLVVGTKPKPVAPSKPVPTPETKNELPHSESAENTSKKEEKSNNARTEQTIYTVNPGDNFWIIARDNDTTVEKLLELNPNVNYRDLKVGQKIRIN